MTGCTSSFTGLRPAEYYPGVAEQAAGNASLFTSDSAVLGDADIARILAYDYAPPSLNRIALLPFGWNAWAAWSEEMAVSTAQVNERVLSTLRTSPKIYDASFLPSILVPDKRTVPYLREAAARYQADLLLVFRTGCRAFERSRLFEPDQTRAYCAVEAVVLDVRTGLVPFTASATQSYDATQAKSDLDFNETVMRSQLTAIASGLAEVAGGVVTFLDSAVTSNSTTLP